MKHILVAGGAGFIGTNLCYRLINDGHYVTCLDNFTTGQIKNISNLLRHKRFNLIKGDIINFQEMKVDEIYNLACPASPVHYQADPVKVIETSVIGATNLLKNAYRFNAKILQASTSEVYGNPIEHPQSENYWGNVNPIGPRSCYDEGKRCAESLFMAYRNQYKVRVKIIRIFNTYGPYMSLNDGRVVSNFILQALKGENITIYGSGEQTRCFQYVDDLIEGLLATMATNEDCIGPINLGNPYEITINQLAERILELTKSKSKIVYKPIPIDDPQRRKPLIKKASKYLNGWYPKVNLSDGLQKTISYFMNIM